MLGIAFAGLYQLVEFVAPGSFSVANAESGRWGPWETEVGVYPRLFFFSFVTLTTLGYGDMTPASPIARSFALLESITGVLYVAVMVASLVGGFEEKDGDQAEDGY